MVNGRNASNISPHWGSSLSPQRKIFLLPGLVGRNIRCQYGRGTRKFYRQLGKRAFLTSKTALQYLLEICDVLQAPHDLAFHLCVVLGGISIDHLQKQEYSPASNKNCQGRKGIQDVLIHYPNWLLHQKNIVINFNCLSTQGSQKTFPKG